MSNKVRKSVSFNVTNENDKEYLEHIEGINFSGYVKELIKREVMKKKARERNGSTKIVIGGNTEHKTPSLSSN